jgi:paraquat-inducible protein A
VLKRGESLRCKRCGEVVMIHRTDDSFHASCALGMTGVCMALLANVYPIMTFAVAGNTQSNLIITGGQKLIDQGYWPISVLVIFCAIAAPALYFASVAYVSACCLGWKLPAGRFALHVAGFMESWSLIPVFAIACVVAVVKLDMIGTVAWKVGIGWIVLLAAVSLGLSRVFDEDSAERRLEGRP